MRKRQKAPPHKAQDVGNHTAQNDVVGQGAQGEVHHPDAQVVGKQNTERIIPGQVAAVSKLHQIKGGDGGEQHQQGKKRLLPRKMPAHKFFYTIHDRMDSFLTQKMKAVGLPLSKRERRSIFVKKSSALKSETVVEAPESGAVTYYAREGTEIGKNGVICSINENGTTRTERTSASSQTTESASLTESTELSESTTESSAETETTTESTDEKEDALQTTDTSESGTLSAADAKKLCAAAAGYASAFSYQFDRYTSF